jgi:hypothetical protein
MKLPILEISGTPEKNRRLYNIENMFLRFAIVACCACCLFSCTPSHLTPNPGPPQDTTVTPVRIPDSIFVLSYIHGCSSGSVQFAYDEKNHRYYAVSGTSANTYDSTKIYYNPDGTISSFIRTTPGGLLGRKWGTTVLTYHNNKQIDKIYTKIGTEEGLLFFDQAASTWVGDSSAAIGSCDSINYDDKNRIISTYRVLYNEGFYNTGNGANDLVIYYRPGKIDFCRKFYYNDPQDSLLNRVEEYDVDTLGVFTHRGNYEYYSYDNNPNPFFKVCPIYGLIYNKTNFISQAYSGLNNYNGDAFLNFGPHNATSSSEDGTVSYTYTDFGFPDRCYRNYYACDWTECHYIKVPK